MKRKKTKNFDYYAICKECTDLECCAEPYFVFVARNEIPRIEAFLKEFPKLFWKFVEVDYISYQGAEYEYYGIKKVNTKCFFLQGTRTCLIHPVKPLHCRCWPLVWAWKEETNQIEIYMDKDPSCRLTQILSHNKSWIEYMKRTIRKEVRQMPKIDRYVFTWLETDDTLQLIDVLDLLE
ncbi:MAG: YkgJ family cysteine cluster protein [Candidatus Helarchaeota archaeon]